MMKKFAAIALVVAVLAGQNAFAGNWTVDKSHSTVKFKVKHLLTNVWGEFTNYTVDLDYNQDNPSASTVRVEVNINSIDTGNEKRDEHLKSPDFFNAEMYPTMTFVSKEVKPMGDMKLKVMGDLTIRGETHPIELMVEGPSKPIMFMGMTKAAASAEATINRTMWGLNWNRALEAGGVVVGEEVTIVIDVELDKAE